MLKETIRSLRPSHARKVGMRLICTCCLHFAILACQGKAKKAKDADVEEELDDETQEEEEEEIDEEVDPEGGLDEKKKEEGVEQKEAKEDPENEGVKQQEETNQDPKNKGVKQQEETNRARTKEEHAKQQEETDQDAKNKGVKQQEETDQDPKNKGVKQQEETDQDPKNEGVKQQEETDQDPKNEGVKQQEETDQDPQNEGVKQQEETTTHKTLHDTNEDSQLPPTRSFVEESLQNLAAEARAKADELEKQEEQAHLEDTDRLQIKHGVFQDCSMLYTLPCHASGFLLAQDRAPLCVLPAMPEGVSYDLEEQAAIFLSCLENRAQQDDNDSERHQNILQAGFSDSSFLFKFRHVF